MAKDRERMGTDRPDVERLIRRVVDTAGPGAVFGEPVAAGERVVLPVARVVLGAGGGWGGATASDEVTEVGAEAPEGEGAGGGFGVGVTPMGFIELTPDGVRFHQIVNWVPLALGGMLLSALWALVVLLLGLFGKRRAG